MSLVNNIRSMIEESAENIKQMASSEEFIAQFEEIISLLVETYKNGGCLFVAGNGGSAADAQHIVAELVVKLHKNRSPIRAFALTTDSSILTAIGNDYGFDQLFSRQLLAGATEKDIFIAISTSGNSINIINALNVARKIGCKSILLTGKSGGKAKELADLTIAINAQKTHLIQEGHIVIYHQLCHHLEKALVDLGICSYLD